MNRQILSLRLSQLIELFFFPPLPFLFFSKRGFSVRSFGTGTHVKLPGPAPDKPNVYDFKTTYDQMYSDLLRKDKELYPCGRAFQNPALCSFPRRLCAPLHKEQLAT